MQNRRIAFLFGSPFHDPKAWEKALRRHLPELDFRLWPDGVGDAAQIEFALVLGGQRGMYTRFPNLKAILSFGAGVDHLLADPELPKHVPIGRGISEGLVENMTQYVVHWVLHFHRGFHLYREQQREPRWRHLRGPNAGERGVGFLGLGALGTAAALRLAGFGFAVAGWSRTPKAIAGVESFHGEDALIPFLKRTQILVNLLPLTPATLGIIDSRTLAALPAGAFVINPGRGEHVVDDDLLAALESGHIAAAALDVFKIEPLPLDHPYWRHPNVYVTPHGASWNIIDTSAAHHADNVRRVLAGHPPEPLVDRGRGY